MRADRSVQLLRSGSCVLALMANQGCPTPASTAVEPRADTATFHGGRNRLGWNDLETSLTPTAVAGDRFGMLWESEALDSVTVGGRLYPPLVYATPLHLDDVTLSAGPNAGRTLSLVFVATSNGMVYAINARESPWSGPRVPAGAIVWRRALGNPDVVPTLDGGVLMGVMGTPFVDRGALTPTLYAVAMDRDAGWRAYALDLRSGEVLPGWPVDINNATLARVNHNGPALFPDARMESQRGALNLSPDGGVLYVPFGAYNDGAVGWMVAIDTRSARIAAAFSGAPSLELAANAGIWGPGGAAIDPQGNVFVTTGNSPEGPGPQVWGESLLRWSPPLNLSGTYTPFNHCQMDRADIDLGGSSPILFDLDPSETSTPHLMAFGGKQGSVYLLDRDGLALGRDRRPACDTDASHDGSLLAPEVQPQYGTRGPINVFGPYSEEYANRNFARMRSTPAAYRDARGRWFLFATGSTKTEVHSETSRPPSVVRLRVVTSAGSPAWLAIDGRETSISLLNPGSPVLTSHGGLDPIVWVLDQNARRTDSLLDPRIAHPVLFAIDGVTLQVLWRSTKNQLHLAGKYGTVTVAHGVVFVATDRLQAFGLTR